MAETVRGDADHLVKPFGIGHGVAMTLGRKLVHFIQDQLL